MFEQDERYLVSALGAYQEMGQVSGQIVDEPAIMKLAYEDVVVFGLDPSVQLLFNYEGLAG